MSTQEFKPGDKVKCIRSSATGSNPAVTAGDEYAIDVLDGDMVSVDGMPSYWWSTDRFVLVEPEWAVGQQVSGTDYERLPVGSRARHRLALADIVKAESGEWTFRGVLMAEPEGSRRTLTHLGEHAEHAEPEDT
ncbi:MAG: hypothetical protein ACRDTJ_16385, partial [Pseudonocardiaceae bacterium]